MRIPFAKAAPKVLVLAALVLLAVVMLVAVLPTSTLLDQRDELSVKRAKLAELNTTNEELTAAAIELRTRDAVELIARRDYGLVMPGEEVFAVLPAAPEPIPLPDAWPFTDLARELQG